MSFAACSSSICRSADKHNQVFNKYFHLLGLGIHFFRGGSRFFSVGCILLDNLIHFAYRLIYLFNALGLLAGCRRYLGNQFAHFCGTGSHLGKLGTRFFNYLRSLFDFLDGTLDQVRGILCRIGRSHGQISDLVGNDCESGPGLTRTGGFNGRIQREKVSLECYLIYGFYYFGCFLACPGNFVHRGSKLGHGIIGLGDNRAGFGHQMVGLVGVFGILFCHRGHFFKR